MGGGGPGGRGAAAPWDPTSRVGDETYSVDPSESFSSFLNTAWKQGVIFSQQKLHCFLLLVITFLIPSNIKIGGMIILFPGHSQKNKK